MDIRKVNPSMSIQYIGKPLINQIISDGIVLNLNLTDIRSYPGSGTTWSDLSPSGLSATGGSAITNQTIGSGQPYTTATTSILNTDTHSIFFSIQINGTSGSWDKIFGYESGGSDRSPGVWRYPSTRRIHWRYDPNNTGADFSTNAVGNDVGTEFVPNTWYYIGVTKNGSIATSYVNGVSLGTQTVSNPKTSGTAQVKIFPVHTAGLSFIKHVHIYNRVLSTQEVLYNFNAIRNTLSL